MQKLKRKHLLIFLLVFFIYTSLHVSGIFWLLSRQILLFTSLFLIHYLMLSIFNKILSGFSNTKLNKKEWFWIIIINASFISTGFFLVNRPYVLFLSFKLFYILWLMYHFIFKPLGFELCAYLENWKNMCSRIISSIFNYLNFWKNFFVVFLLFFLNFYNEKIKKQDFIEINYIQLKKKRIILNQTIAFGDCFAVPVY